MSFEPPAASDGLPGIGAILRPVAQPLSCAPGRPLSATDLRARRLVRCRRRGARPWRTQRRPRSSSSCTRPRARPQRCCRSRCSSCWARCGARSSRPTRSARAFCRRALRRSSPRHQLSPDPGSHPVRHPFTDVDLFGSRVARSAWCVARCASYKRSAASRTTTTTTSCAGCWRVSRPTSRCRDDRHAICAPARASPPGLILCSRSSLQLSELVQCEDYKDWIAMVATFTVDSFKHWEWASNSVYYLLSVWSRLVASMP